MSTRILSVACLILAWGSLLILMTGIWRWTLLFAILSAIFAFLASFSGRKSVLNGILSLSIVLLSSLAVAIALS